MRRGFVARVNRVIWQADIVLEVVDARFAAETRNFALERKIASAGKRLIIVINKSDLVGVGKAKQLKKDLSKDFPAIFVNAKERQGMKKLVEAIGKAAAGKRAKVAVIGYPNTGKSSVINALRGRKAALVSRKAGFTRGEQIVRISKNISLIDSPGVIPAEERDEFKLFLLGAKNPQDMQDKELVAMRVIEFVSREKPNALGQRYGIAAAESGERTLEEIALRRKKLLKGGKPDTAAAARIVLEDWSKGRLGS